MSEPGDRDAERERGILTQNDESWLRGESKYPFDRKRRCSQGLQFAIEDIKRLIETDPEDVDNLDGIGDLFTDIEENTGLDRVECAENLIALAFIITNDSIDYSELAERVDWHPRSSSERPSDSDRSQSARPPTYDVSEMLGFRNALSGGIKLGKEYVHRPEEMNLDHPLIKSNTNLYKEPTKANVNPDENRLDFEVVRNIYSGLLDATLPLSTITEDLRVEPNNDDYEPTIKEAEDFETLQVALENLVPRGSLEVDGRDTAAEYIAQDIEMMVNREVVRRHELLSKDRDFGYELPENIGGEVPGRIIPPSLGRRSTDSNRE